jgi:hypothetical protein
MLLIAEQLTQLIRKTLDLQDLTVLDTPGCTDDGIAGTDKQIRVGIDRTRTVLESPDEAIMETREVLLARLCQVQIGEVAPGTDRQVANQGMLKLAEPSEEASGQSSWDTVGQ